jgi:tetratricopeptide (TPR) repeat protein
MVRFVVASLSVTVVSGAVVLATAQSTESKQPQTAPAPAVSAAPLAPELSGLGTWQLRVSAKVARAQRFFDQGLRLLYGFNHPESLRAFREAARLDPGLAMAYWGQAMALGPNLNAPLTPENAAAALAALEQAKARAGGAAPLEQALIDAQVRRFRADGERAALDKGYADAMRAVASRFPNDADVQTLLADALMNTMPWDYWQKDGSAKPDTAVALGALERVLARQPDHPGANHYHIHLLEASNDPDRAVTSADRLGPLMPAAGHMVHMPSHIYLRVGRYRDAAEWNERAILADEDYLAQCQAQGLYPVSYYPHNVHFLWAAATLEGRSAVAIAAARRVAEKVPHHHAGAVAWTADFPVTPMLAYARFGRWADILTTPEPPAQEPYARGIWHYGRALAFTARSELTRAREEIGRVEALVGHEAFKTRFKDSPLATALTIAARMAAGELAARAGRVDDAVASLREALTLEDGLAYNEPPVWHHPTRQVLGAVLLEAGRAKEAEQVYREDLARVRENGWSLFGLSRSLSVQGKDVEAAEVQRRYEKAWARADITLTSSRIMPRPGTAKTN